MDTPPTTPEPERGEWVLLALVALAVLVVWLAHRFGYLAR